MSVFPKGFFWGAATSSYQVEGGNSNCDWWAWEKSSPKREQSGQACKHYQLYKEDFDLAKSLNHNAHRFSIEWSRVQPEQDLFSQEAIDHYQDVVKSLRDRNLEPIVTLHHFTNPIWLSAIGGWENKKTIKLFLVYVERLVSALCESVRFWVTINEPNVYAYHAYLLGVWPPQKTSIASVKRVTDNFVAAHIAAYKLIHSIYKKRGLPSPFVSIAQNAQAFLACKPTLRNNLAVYLRNKVYNLDFITKIAKQGAVDYIGINYYSRSLVDTYGWGIRNIGGDVCKDNHNNLDKNSLGWEIYPEGLYDLLMQFKRYNLPLFILENGICTNDDSKRWEYIRQHLKSVNRAMDDGCKILGYIYWSLIDNFEWDKGYAPRFGLIDVNYSTFQRTVRESARKFASVCQTGRIE